jgi:hypothetical protein
MSELRSQETRKADPNCESCNGSGRIGSTDDDSGKRIVEDCPCTEREPDTRVEESAPSNTVKDRADLQDALLDLRARLVIPASKWNAQTRAEALTLIDRAIGDL